MLSVGHATAECETSRESSAWGNAEASMDSCWGGLFRVQLQHFISNLVFSVTFDSMTACCRYRLLIVICTKEKGFFSRLICHKEKSPRPLRHSKRACCVTCVSVDGREERGYIHTQCSLWTSEWFPNIPWKTKQNKTKTTIITNEPWDNHQFSASQAPRLGSEPGT